MLAHHKCNGNIDGINCSLYTRLQSKKMCQGHFLLFFPNPIALVMAVATRVKQRRANPDSEKAETPRKVGSNARPLALSYGNELCHENVSCHG